MKNQALFSSKDKSKELKCRLLPFQFGALRVKNHFQTTVLILETGKGSNIFYCTARNCCLVRQNLQCAL